MHAEFGISTMQVPHVHDSTPIFNGKAVGQHLGHHVPVLGGEARLKALIHSACRVFQPRRRLAEFFEPRDRGVQVCLVEYLAAVDQVAFDRHYVDLRHSASKPSREVPCRRMGEDRSEVAQPMHGLDVDADVLARVPSQRGSMRSASPGANDARPPVVDVYPVRRRRRKFAPVERGVGPRDDRPRVRVGGRFAGEVPGIEFVDGGVEVLEVEHDDRRDPAVGVGLDEAEHISEERLGRSSTEKRVRVRTRRSPRVAMTST